MAHAMRAALAASNSGSGSAGGEHWLLWLDSDVLVVDGAAALTNNFAADLEGQIDGERTFAHPGGAGNNDSFIVQLAGSGPDVVRLLLH